LRRPFLLLICILISSHGFTQSAKKNDTTQIYYVGYQNIITTDSSRHYKPGVSITDKFYYRPVEIDFWYPATGLGSNSSVQFGDFLNLLEQRSNRFQDDTVYRRMGSDLLEYICLNLKIRDTSKMAHLKTNSFRNAGAFPGKFPLIIYMAAYNGMSYENINLFEWLASHGYAVACITSVGRYPGNMSTQPADLMEQVFDGSFAVDLLKRKSNIDQEKIGAMGYSWGGLAALTMAMYRPEIKAVLSFDGSEMHYYGQSAEEDEDFDKVRSSLFFQSKKINIPYAYLESGSKQNDETPDSIFDILPSLSYKKQYVHFPKAQHEDFSCLPTLAIMNDQIKKANPDLYQLFLRFSLNYFDTFLKNKSGLLSKQLAIIYDQHIGDSLYPTTNITKKAVFSIKGKVVDRGNREALAYTNIGIPDKNIGTVSGRDGSFRLNVSAELNSDSLTFSMAGYISQSVRLEDLLKRSQPILIQLEESISELKEVTITKKNLSAKKIGNLTTSNFISVGLPLKFLGSEIGIKISLGKKPVQLKSFNFNISDSRMDTAVFRLNIYQFDHGIPTQNILRKNIFIPVGKRKGRYTINLSEYKLLMKSDILISIEWIEGSFSGKGNGIIFLSAGLLNSATWHRLASQGKWKKATGLGVGFNLDVQ
jgi:dienelactone hydrolase